jgi:hypothetical protein
MASQSGASIQVNPTIHYKLVLLGDASVGKSCLVVRYVYINRLGIASADSLVGISTNSRNPLLARLL